MSAAIDPTVFPTLALWKFMSLSDGQSPDWRDRLRQLAVEGRAYFPSPLDFNDPFDCVPHVPVPETTEEIKKSGQILINRMIASLKDYPADFIRCNMEEAFSIANPETLAQAVRKSVSLTAGKMGVFCLSERIDSILMWSHYADNHQGIALRFDCKVQPLSGLMPMFKVKYQIERPELQEFFSEKVNIRIADALATKADVWAYEQEWRSLRPSAARSFVKFDPNVVTGVILGPKCTADSEDEIREILRGRDIDFMKAVPASETFTIDFFARID